MLSWRARRQSAAILFVVIVLVVIFAPRFWKLIPAASCFDNKRNQDETGADCGGPCGSCELKNPKNLTVFWSKYLLVREGNYDVAAYVQNPNETLSSAKLDYEFVLYDDLGVIGYKSGQTFIYPREKLYLVESGIQTSRLPTAVEFKIKKVAWTARDFNLPELTVDKKEYRVLDENGKLSVVEAAISNRSSFNLREAELTFVVLGQNENLLGINKSLLDNFEARTSRSLRTTWPNEFGETPASVIVDPRINLFKTSAILQP